MEKKTLGIMIAERRKASGMTQAELAEKMGITDKAVSKWERDISYPDISTLPHLAEVLGVSIDELMTCRTPSSEEMKSKDKSGNLLAIICRAIALAMGVAVAVLSVLHSIDTTSALTMLGIGLGALALSAMHKEQ